MSDVSETDSTLPGKIVLPRVIKKKHSLSETFLALIWGYFRSTSMFSSAEFSFSHFFSRFLCYGLNQTWENYLKFETVCFCCVNSLAINIRQNSTKYHQFIFPFLLKHLVCFISAFELFIISNKLILTARARRIEFYTLIEKFIL